MFQDNFYAAKPWSTSFNWSFNWCFNPSFLTLGTLSPIATKICWTGEAREALLFGIRIVVQDVCEFDLQPSSDKSKLQTRTMANDSPYNPAVAVLRGLKLTGKG